MTNQVAITMLKNLEQSLDDYCELNDEGKEAFHMAISALELFGNSEQLPSVHSKLEKNSTKLDNENGELISRQDAIDLVKSFYKIDKSVLKIMVFKLKQLPFVQPETNCSEIPNNSDLISRQAAIDALKICDANYDGTNCDKCPLRDERWKGAWYDNEIDCYTKLMRDSAKLLELPRKGKWIEHDDDWANVYYECSVCKEPFVLIDGTPTENLYNFCPNCGCRMEEGDPE